MTSVKGPYRYNHDGQDIKLIEINGIEYHYKATLLDGSFLLGSYDIQSMREKDLEEAKARVARQRSDMALQQYQRDQEKMMGFLKGGLFIFSMACNLAGPALGPVGQVLAKVGSHADKINFD